jgi:hypothetical protein
MTLAWQCSKDTIKIYVGNSYGFKQTSAIVDGCLAPDWSSSEREWLEKVATCRDLLEREVLETANREIGVPRFSLTIL